MSIPAKTRFVGSDVFIIGGGPSLGGFDFSRLRGRNTIGCNAAFKLGASVCNICIFSDLHWFDSFYSDLQAFGGAVVTHCPHLRHERPGWLMWEERRECALPKDGLGGSNSGAAAISLALRMGAKRVFLLGFDGSLSASGRSNWHADAIEAPNASVYDGFMYDFEAIARELPAAFPGTEIINLNPSSKIPYFRKEKPDDYLRPA